MLAHININPHGAVACGVGVNLPKNFFISKKSLEFRGVILRAGMSGARRGATRRRRG